MTSKTPGNKQPSTFDIRNRRSVFILSILLFVLVVWAFFPCVQGSFNFYDDQAYIVGNSHVNSGLSWANFLWAFYGFGAANWHPITWLSHMLCVRLFGLNPWGHHLTNVLLHATNTVLVFLVFRKMTGAGWRSLLVAGLFGLHPLRVESVAWISERKDVLSTMFWLLAMWAYAKFAEESQKMDGKSKPFYGLTLLWFALGLMSKAMLVTLPFVFLLLDYWPLKRWGNGKRDLILEKTPLFLLAIFVSTITYVAQQRGGAMQEMINLPLSDRWGNALISYVRYLGKFFWPENLCVEYPHPGHWPFTEVLAAGALLICVSFLAVALREGRPYLLVGWLWYLGSLAPVIGLVQVGSQSIADRYTYVPLMGACLILVWGLSEAAARWRKELIVTATVAITACIIVTRHQIEFWEDDISLWSHAIAVTKDNYVAHENLGNVLLFGQPDRAFAEFKKAVELNPDYADAQRHLADEYYVRGLYDDAIAHYQKSLETDPASGVAEFALGFAYYKKGRLDDAIVHFQKSVDSEPDNLNRRNNLGAVLLASGKVDAAIVQFQIALKQAPDFTAARSNLDLALGIKGQTTKTNQPPK